MKKGIKNIITKILVITIFSVCFMNRGAVQAAIQLGIKEDVNSDGIVDELDTKLVSSKYNISSTSNLYNEKYDINSDNIIDIYDFIKVSNKIGVITQKISYVTASELNVRSGPGTNYKIIGSLRRNAKVEVIGQASEWYKIKYNDGYGYVHTDYITDKKPTTTFNHSLDYYVDIIMGIKGATQTDKYGGGWKDAKREDVEYYMNPENFVNGIGKYMFMDLNFIEGVSEEAAGKMIAGKGILNGTAKAFLSGAEKHDVNPIYLIAHAILETGNGTSKLAKGIVVNEVDGKPVPEKTVYNMFGIGAYDRDPIKYGSERAYEEGWFTPELAIIGGSKWIGSGYINNPKYLQDTLYEMRWNLTPTGVGSHRYATDIAWAYKQAHIMSNYIKYCPEVKFEYDIPKFTPTLKEAFEEMINKRW